MYDPKAYDIKIEEGSAGMGRYKVILSFPDKTKEVFVHQFSEKGACSFARKKYSGGMDCNIGVNRIGPVNPGKYRMRGRDEMDVIKNLVDECYKTAVNSGIIDPLLRNHVPGISRESITKCIYNKWKKGEGVEISPPDQMELFGTDM